jgi:hypothetical protein
VAT